MRLRYLPLALVALIAACSSSTPAAPPVGSVNDLQIQVNSTGQGDSQVLNMALKSNSSKQLTSTYTILDYEDSKPARTITATISENRKIGLVSEESGTVERSFSLIAQSVDVPQSLADETVPEATEYLDLTTRTYSLNARGVATTVSAPTGAERQANITEPRTDVGPDAVAPATDLDPDDAAATGSEPIMPESPVTTTTEPPDEATTNGAVALDTLMSELWAGGPLPSGAVSVGARWHREGSVRLSADDVAVIKQRWEIVEITPEGYVLDGYADVDVSLRLLVPDRFSSRKVSNGRARAVLTSDFRGLIGFDGLTVDAVENRSFQTSLVYQDRTYRLRRITAIETSPS